VAQVMHTTSRDPVGRVSGLVAPVGSDAVGA
jgi:hypothetical protein